MPAARFKRTRILIDPDIQVRLSVRLAFCLAGYMALFGVIALAEPLAVLLGVVSSDLSPEAAMQTITYFSSAVLAPLLFAVACMVLHGVLILHRLAGPVFRVRKAMSALLNRDLTDRIYLRDKDYLLSLAETYNRCAEQLHADLEAAGAGMKELLAADLDKETRDRALHVDAILGSYRLNLDAGQDNLPPADGPEENPGVTVAQDPLSSVDAAAE